MDKNLNRYHLHVYFKYAAFIDDIMSFMSQGVFLRTVADRVRTLRLRSGSTQADFAARASIALPTYRVFERTGRISLERLYRIAVILGRMGELAGIFTPLPFTSLEQLIDPPTRKRGRRKTALDP